MFSLNPALDFDFVTIPKEVFSTEFDQDLYLYKYITTRKPLKLIYYDYDHEYFVYHKTFGFDIKPFQNIVKEYVDKRFATRVSITTS